ARHHDVVRRPAPRDLRLPRVAGAPDARPHRGADPGRERHPRVREHAPAARAAHPPREGDQQHLHERGARGDHGRRVSLAPRPGGPARRRASGRRARARAREASRRASRLRHRQRRSVLRSVHAPHRDRGMGSPERAHRARDPGRGDRVALHRRPSRGPGRRDRAVHRAHDRRGRGRARRRRCAARPFGRDGGGAMTLRTQVIPDAGAKTPVPALEPLLFELARPGRSGRHVVSDAAPEIPDAFRRKTALRLPELTEPQVVRHYTHLAQLNYSVDTGMYPLGSCTMKYNPKVNDRVASLFADLHPRQSYRTTQGVLALAYEIEQMLAKITGMDFVSLQPQAGAQSEFTALLVFKAYHAKRGEAAPRRPRLRLRPHQRPQDVLDAPRRRRPGRGSALREGPPASVPAEAVDRARGRRLVSLRHRARGPRARRAGRLDRHDQAAPGELRCPRTRLYLYEDAGGGGHGGDGARRDPRRELPARAAPPGVRPRVRSPADARVRDQRGETEEAGRVRARRLEGAARRGLSLADGVLPAHRARGDDDRAHRDGAERDARRVRGRDAAYRRTREDGSRRGARRPTLHAAPPPRRSYRRAKTDPPLEG